MPRKVARNRALPGSRRSINRHNQPARPFWRYSGFPDHPRFLVAALALIPIRLPFPAAAPAVAGFWLAVRLSLRAPAALLRRPLLRPFDASLPLPAAWLPFRLLQLGPAFAGRALLLAWALPLLCATLGAEVVCPFRLAVPPLGRAVLARASTGRRA